jgi:serine/threonine protein kinase
MNSADCLSLAHRDAFGAKVLHRDLSPGNIIIDSNGNGLLIDWDLSKPLDVNNKTFPRRATRTVRVKAVSQAVMRTNVVFIRVPGSSCLAN